MPWRNETGPGSISRLSLCPFTLSRLCQPSASIVVSSAHSVRQLGRRRMRRQTAKRRAALHPGARRCVTSTRQGTDGQRTPTWRRSSGGGSSPAGSPGAVPWAGQLGRPAGAGCSRRWPRELVLRPAPGAARLMSKLDSSSATSSTISASANARPGHLAPSSTACRSPPLHEAVWLTTIALGSVTGARQRHRASSQFLHNLSCTAARPP